MHYVGTGEASIAELGTPSKSYHFAVRLQAAINAAFAEDGELIFVGSEQNVHLGEVTANVAQRPDSAKKRPASARKGTKAAR
jgi:hypothetical protein